MNTAATLSSGLNVPQFFYGTAWKEERTETLVRSALSAGFRAIDTANQRKHYHEAAVGQALKAAYISGEICRGDVFLQTKFTHRRGQDHRLPYDPKASIDDQVWQSAESSLAHLHTDIIDSFVLHGPSVKSGLHQNDWDAWRAMEALHAAGTVRYLGISNVSLEQLTLLCDGAHIRPRFVQNRCYANKKWDKYIRDFCTTNGITYQGFSLLTANRAIFRHPHLDQISRRHGMSASQTIFRFALDCGMIPLTGTSSVDHMKHDLLADDFKLTEADINSLENLAVQQ